MSDIIFAKSAYERKPQFQICTKILKKNTGEKFVIKESLSKEADAHISSLYGKYQLLESTLKGRLSVVPAKREIDNAVCFDFLEGHKFSELINKEIESGNWENAYVLIEDFYNEIKKMTVNSADIVEEFYEIFGRFDLPEGLHYMKPANIDLIFDNIVYEENKGYQLLDYEWCFDFAVPIEYIMYRSILLLPSMANLEQEEQRQIWNIVGISDKMKETFYNMEVAFQRYVYGNDRKLECILKKIGTSKEQFDEVLSWTGRGREYEIAYKESSEKANEYFTAYHKEEQIRCQYERQAQEYREAYQVESKRRIDTEEELLRVQGQFEQELTELQKIQKQLQWEQEKFKCMSWVDCVKYIRQLKSGEKQ